MSAFYFGPVERSLFGWFHPAAVLQQTCGVVLCYPLGWEHIRCFRGFRRLAAKFAAAGFPTLRFDYDGTGDSVGDDSDPARLEAWKDSIGLAVAALKAQSGTERTALFGARMGATLAMTFAAERGGIDRLMLWNPCLTGRSYVREMRAFRKMGLATTGDAGAPGVREGDEEAAGFLLTRGTLEELAILDLLAAGPSPAPAVLVLARDEISPEDRLVNALQRRGSAVELRRIAGYDRMVVEMHQAEVPLPLFDSAIAWLKGSLAGAGDPAQAGAPQGTSAAPKRTSCAVSLPTGSRLGRRPAVREEAVFLGDEPRMFGIVTDPLPGPAACRTAVVLINNGSIHRVGSNRMYVAMARAWASRGLTVLRMDLAGLGDSPPRGGRGENVLYSSGAADEVRQAMTWLGAARPVDQFVLLGLCSGAFAVFHCARAGAPLRGAILINPQIYYWKEGDALEVAQTRTYSDLQAYKQSLVQTRKWLKLVRGEVSLSHLGGLLVARASDVAGAKLTEGLRRLGIRGSRPRLDTDLRAIVEQGTFLWMAFSQEDPGLDYLDLNAGREVERLRRRDNFRFDIIPSADHTFTSLRAQRRLIDVITSHLEHEFALPSDGTGERRAAT